MITTNCDRCKKQVTNYIELTALYDSNLLEERYIRVNKKYQLCKDCIKELEAFIALG